MSADRDKYAMFVKQKHLWWKWKSNENHHSFIRQTLKSTVNQVPNSAASSLKSWKSSFFSFHLLCVYEKIISLSFETRIHIKTVEPQKFHGRTAQERIAPRSKTLPWKGLLRMDAKQMITCDPMFSEGICCCARFDNWKRLVHGLTIFGEMLLF